MLPVAARALPQDYTILAVGVDTSREKAANYAMHYARQRAMFLAATKLGVKTPEQAIKRLSPQAVTQIIRGTTVEKTQRIGEKTYQQIRVTVVEDALMRALGMNAAAAQPRTAKTRTVLLVPVLVTPTKTWVWEKENTLRAPLSDEILRQARGTVILPSGDLEDLKLIDRDNATNAKYDELKPMLARYGVDEVVIAALQRHEEGSPEPSRVLLHRISPKARRDEVVELPPDSPEDTPEIRMLAAVRAIAAAATQIASSTDEDIQDTLAAATKIPLRFIYTTPKELARLTETVRTAPGVLQLELPAIMLNNVVGKIYLEGNDSSALRKYLAGKGIIIRDVGNEWSAAAR